MSLGDQAIEAFKLDHGDLFQDVGIDSLGSFRQPATVNRGKTNRLAVVVFQQLFFQATTFRMTPFDFPLLVALRPVNQPCLQPIEHNGSLMRRCDGSNEAGHQAVRGIGPRLERGRLRPLDQSSGCPILGDFSLHDNGLRNQPERA